MDLLESILQTCKAEKYLTNFKDNGIDAFTLKILGEEDLKVIGIEEEVLRKLILKHVSTLQLPSENPPGAHIGHQYAYQISNIISMQLNRHYGNVTAILKREDIALCDIKLSPAVDCLQDSLVSLEKRLSQFEERIFIIKPKKKEYFILIPALLSSLVVIVCYKGFNYLMK